MAKLLSRLDWLCDFFDTSVHRLEPAALAGHNASSIGDIVASSGAGLIEARLDIGDTNAINLLESAGFRFEDLRITFAANVDQLIEAAPPEGVTIDLAGSADEDAAAALAGQLLAPDSRFRRPFGDDRTREFYETWARNAIAGTFDNEMLAARADGRLIGFCTLAHKSDTSTIGIIGVDPGAGFSGVGKALVSRCRQRCTDQGTASLIVATEGRNLGAQNFYIKTGFLTASIDGWFYFTA